MRRVLVDQDELGERALALAHEVRAVELADVGEPREEGRGPSSGAGGDVGGGALAATRPPRATSRGPASRARSGSAACVERDRASTRPRAGAAPRGRQRERAHAAARATPRRRPSRARARARAPPPSTWRTAAYTSCGRAKRTSSFCGCTLTSRSRARHLEEERRQRIAPLLEQRPVGLRHGVQEPAVAHARRPRGTDRDEEVGAARRRRRGVGRRGTRARDARPPRPRPRGARPRPAAPAPRARARRDRGAAAGRAARRP